MNGTGQVMNLNGLEIVGFITTGIPGNGCYFKVASFLPPTPEDENPWGPNGPADWDNGRANDVWFHTLDGESTAPPAELQVKFSVPTGGRTVTFYQPVGRGLEWVRFEIEGFSTTGVSGDIELFIILAAPR